MEAFTWLPRAGESKPKRMTRLMLKHSSRPVCRVLPGGPRFALVFTSIFVNSILRLLFLDSPVLSIKRLLVAGVLSLPSCPTHLFCWPPVLASGSCEPSTQVSRIRKPACRFSPSRHTGISGCYSLLAASKQRHFKLKQAGFRCFIFISASDTLRALRFLGFVMGCVLLPRSWVPP